MTIQLQFSLLSQCFQDIGPTKWTSVIAKQCPNGADRTKANFDKCIRDYLEAIAGFPNMGNKLIFWLCAAKKPALMPMHEFMWHQMQLLSYLEGDYLCQTMEVPTAQEKSEQIFFAQPKAHHNKFANLNKTVPANPLRMIAIFEQCQATNKAAGVLRRSPRTRSSQSKRKRLMLLPCIAVNQATIIITVTSTMIIIEVTDGITTIANLTIVIKIIDARIVVDATTRTGGATSPMTRRMIASTIIFKKKSNEAMHNDQSSKLSAGNLSRKRT